MLADGSAMRPYFGIETFDNSWKRQPKERQLKKNYSACSSPGAYNRAPARLPGKSTDPPESVKRQAHGGVRYGHQTTDFNTEAQDWVWLQPIIAKAANKTAKASMNQILVSILWAVSVKLPFMG